MLKHVDAFPYKILEVISMYIYTIILKKPVYGVNRFDLVVGKL